MNTKKTPKAREPKKDPREDISWRYFWSVMGVGIVLVALLVGYALIFW